MEIATKRVDIQRLGELKPGVLRVRSDGKRIYAEDFKADLVRQCLVPGTSVAATAMTHGINANLLRRWIVLQGSPVDGRHLRLQIDGRAGDGSGVQSRPCKSSEPRINKGSAGNFGVSNPSDFGQVRLKS